jgi:hypothetical protein
MIYTPNQGQSTIPEGWHRPDIDYSSIEFSKHTYQAKREKSHMQG